MEPFLPDAAPVSSTSTDLAAPEEIAICGAAKLRAHPLHALIFGDPGQGRRQLRRHRRDEEGPRNVVTVSLDGHVLSDNREFAAIVAAGVTTVSVRVAPRFASPLEEAVALLSGAGRPLSNAEIGRAFPILTKLVQNDVADRTNLVTVRRARRLAETRAAAILGVDRRRAATYVEIYDEDMPSAVTEAVDAGQLCPFTVRAAVVFERARRPGPINPYVLIGQLFRNSERPELPFFSRRRRERRRDRMLAIARAVRKMKTRYGTVPARTVTIAAAPASCCGIEQ